MRVPRSERCSWWNIAVQRFGQMSDLTQFLLGATLGAGMSFWGAFWAFTLGSVILQIVCVSIGVIGMREGLSTSVLTRWTGFGRGGSALVGAVVAVSLFGWFGIQTAVFAAGLHALMGGIPLSAWCLLSGLSVTALVLKGFHAMGWTAFICVPAFLGVAGWAVTVQLSRHDVRSLIDSVPFGEPLSIASGATIVAGSYLVGAVTSPDMTRFNRSTADVVKQTVVGIALGEYLLGLAGVLLAYAVRTSDVIAIITASAGALGVLIVVTSTIKINNWNLYSSALALGATIEALTGRRPSRRALTVGIGTAGTLAAAAGILDYFTGFLLLMGVLTPPVAGIMIAEYFVTKQWRPCLDASRDRGDLPAEEPSWVPVTLVIWPVAAALGWLAEHFQWPGVPTLTSMLLAGVAYIAAGRLGLLTEKRQNPVRFSEVRSPRDVGNGDSGSDGSHERNPDDACPSPGYSAELGDLTPR
ncbi:purine-cytosine permease family protein [Streptomyces sp. 4.24]|uniref:purine-cytosine permease family protein n=1 Tax=Streptomyces tritrimontium TaxID=3406573 RepID=UPI003BB52F94